MNEEWKKEMMKWRKSDIIDLLAKEISERQQLTETNNIADTKQLIIGDVRLSLHNIKDAATKALLKTRQSKGMETNNIIERELELAERAFINGAIWAKNKYEGNEA